LHVRPGPGTGDRGAIQRKIDCPNRPLHCIRKKLETASNYTNVPGEFYNLDRPMGASYLGGNMCGICGKIMIDPGAPVEEGLIEEMLKVLRHRGPDDTGTASGPGFGLGHARLAILDLTDRARQPLLNEDETLHLVFNGAIYNFQELRADLEANGHRFRSRTDAEVILHLYEELGTECLSRLRGMFAFAVYDRNRHTLFAGRDRLGQKPLVYALHDEALIFASEIKAILKDRSIEAAADMKALDHYLSLGYVPAPRTAFQGIEKLMPGHYLLLRDGRLEKRSYWRLSFRGHDFEPEQKEADLADELEARLDEAVRIRLKSDVPLGALMSGGLDSGAVAALMSRHVEGAIKTFSIGFEARRYDESMYSRALSLHLGTDHSERVAPPIAASLLPRIVWHYNEPFADSSCVPCFHLAKLASESVKVVLNGDGGDESFAGYDRYGAQALAGCLDYLPRALVRAGCGIGTALTNMASRRSRGAARLARFLAHAPDAPVSRYFAWIGCVSEAIKDRLCTAEFRKAAINTPPSAILARAYQASHAPDPVGKTLETDLCTYLPNDLLVKMDVAAMAYGLEARSPFLDHELVEFAAAIPLRMKLKWFRSKHILKRAVQRLVPDYVIQRKKKGFGAPIDAWLRSNLKEMAFDVLTGPRARSRGIFDSGEVKKLLDMHVSGRENRHHEIWALLMLELWFRQFIDA
jgi:asparagine synthase (glutamine-hydrolysing)